MNSKNHTQASSKLSIELREYEIFCAKFDKGLFGAKRFGQAFYDHFKLSKLSDQAALHNLYAKDGDHARRSIQNLFEFT